MEHYIYANRQREQSILYLDHSYILGDDVARPRAILVTYRHTTVERSIDRINRHIAQRYGATIHDLPAQQLTDRDFIIDIPNKLSPRDIVGDSREWGPGFGVTIEKFEGEVERLKLASFRVTVHLKNIPLKIWSRATTTRILEVFGELGFIDDVSFDGRDRRAVYAMVDYHDGKMIPKYVMVYARGFWEWVFVVVMDWVAVNSLAPLDEDFLEGRNIHGKFSSEEVARKSLVWGMERQMNYFNQFRGGNSEGTESEEDNLEGLGPGQKENTGGYTEGENRAAAEGPTDGRTGGEQPYSKK
jgi:hypothetical protein